ncbi:hypothetical protein HGRIS_012554 [Hohenbuehelia grisea]|uniref:Peptidase S53 domain-containing protein n=1 Tax=Hohenbuehelia grisea TaxID=104357 RepID=A0ABR3ISR1_9AGAR
MLALAFGTLLLISSVLADPSISPSVQHEKRFHLPPGWAHVRRHELNSVLPLRFGLAQSNIHKLESFLNDVSHPESPNYGNHWSPAKVAETFAPSGESIRVVKDWLVGSGIDPGRLRLSPTKNWIKVNATVEEAERLLQTEYNVYSHDDTGTEHIACDAYHLPAHVSPHVELVTPSIHFDARLHKRGPAFSGPRERIGEPGVGLGPKFTGKISTLLTELENCDKQITPACLRALYGVLYTPLAANKNSYGIVEYTPQAFLQSDLDMFNKNFSKSLVGKSPKLVAIDGAVVQTNQTGFDFNGESNLDLQYGMNLVTSKQEVTLYQVGDLPQGASFNNLLDALDGSFCSFEGGDDPLNDGIYPDPLDGGFKGNPDCGIVKPANVISTSYGYNEPDLSPAYTARQCAEYAKLGLMGVTVLYSSGDNGVAGNGGLCQNPDGSQSRNGKIFNPGFPGGCPFITSVGATQVNPGAKVTDPEGACEQVIFSGGGWSNYFAIPEYQKTAVGRYLKDFPPPYPPSIWNSTGVSRAFPDLSANGANYVIAVAGEFGLVFGTSASSPVVGAILTLINDARLAIGKKPIGFINPTIYSPSFADGFHDIVMGGNRGCGTPGFNSTPGWDPVTGLGTPNFPKLLAKWLLLP